MTALSIYMMVSLFMIVVALLEFATVLIIKHRSQKMPLQAHRLQKQENRIEWKGNLQMENYLRKEGQSHCKKDAWVESNDSSTSEKPIHERIDGVCFAIFPAIYILFNAIYWAYYGTI